MNASSALLPLLLLAASCASPPAAEVVVIPGPPAGSGGTDLPGLSRRAAGRVVREIEAAGFAALVPGTRARPGSVRLEDAAPPGVDLRIHVWIQAVDLPLPGFPSEPARAWGGLAVLDRGGRELAAARFLKADPASPSDGFHSAAPPGDPRAERAAGEFGETLLRGIHGFAGRLGEALEAR